MKEFFEKALECYSLQEVTQVLQERGITGKIDLGYIETSAQNFFAWKCSMAGANVYVPIMKESEFDTSTLTGIQYAPVQPDEIFISDYRYYYFTAEQEIMRIEQILSEKIMLRIASLLTGQEIEAVSIAHTYPQDIPGRYDVICWAWIDDEDNLYYHPVFVEDGPLFEMRQDQGQRIDGSIIEDGEMFNHGGVIWQKTTSDDGYSLLVPCCMGNLKQRS